MATCPACNEKIRPFGAPPSSADIGVNHVVCPHCSTPLAIPLWVFVVPFLLAIPVAALGYAYLGDAGAVLAILFVSGPLVLLFYTVEPYGETMLDLGGHAPDDEAESNPPHGQTTSRGNS